MLNFFLNMLNILSKDASQWPASLVKIILSKDGSHILLVKTNYLVCS